MEQLRTVAPTVSHVQPRAQQGSVQRYLSAEGELGEKGLQPAPPNHWQPFMSFKTPTSATASLRLALLMQEDKHLSPQDLPHISDIALNTFV